MKTLLQILKLVPFPIVTAIIILIWIDDFVCLMLAAFLWWLTIPAIILSIVFFFIGLRRRDNWQRAAVIWGVVNLLLFVVYLLVQLPNQRCNPDKMAKHYEKHKTEMDALLDYAISAIDDSAYVHIRWEGGRKTIFHVKGADGILSQHWGDAEAKQDSLMKVIGLSANQLDEIHHRLKAMNCFGIMIPNNHEYINIEYQSVYFAIYSYNIYRSPLTAEQRDKVMNDPELIPYNERVSFVFLGGAVGAQEFSPQQKDSYLKKHKPW